MRLKRGSIILWSGLLKSAALWLAASPPAARRAAGTCACLRSLQAGPRGEAGAAALGCDLFDAAKGAVRSPLLWGSAGAATRGGRRSSSAAEQSWHRRQRRGKQRSSTLRRGGAGGGTRAATLVRGSVSALTFLEALCQARSGLGTGALRRQTLGSPNVHFGPNWGWLIGGFCRCSGIVKIKGLWPNALATKVLIFGILAHNPTPVFGLKRILTPTT